MTIRVIDTFADVAVDENGCWLGWGHDNGNGYRRGRHDGRVVYGHRLAYELLVATIPDGYEIDHLCKNVACVAPEHLQAVPPYVNNMRSDSLCARRARQTHCNRGHEFTSENTYERPDRKRSRMCRKCCAMREARRVR
jgi:hypothetical protein